jgi:hypothetical protein
VGARASGDRRNRNTNRTIAQCPFRAAARRVRPHLQNGHPLQHFSVMSGDLRPIIDEIADQADDFLAGARDRAQARAGISELITMDYSDLTPPDRAAVIAGVMKVLEAEDFFNAEFVGDPFADDDEDED